MRHRRGRVWQQGAPGAGGHRPRVAGDHLDLLGDGAERGGDCYAAGGSFIEGTLEIVSIDDDQVVGVLANTEEWEFDADGQFSASRCF